MKEKNEAVREVICVVLSCGMPEKWLWSSEGTPHHLSTWMCNFGVASPLDIWHLKY